MTTSHNPLKAVLFDMDVTLINSLPLTMEAFRHGLKTQGTSRTDDEIMAYFGLGEDEIFKRLLGDNAMARSAYLECAQYTQTHLSAAVMHDGMLDLVQTLHARGIPMGIVTGRSRPTTEILLKHHGLWDPRGPIQIVITHNEVKNGKPDPEGILKALAHLGVSSGSAMYVGDTWMDVRAAREAGVLAAAALWDGLAEEDRILAESPDVSVATAGELLQRILARLQLP